MTVPLFREDPYRREASARVTANTPEGGIVVDRSVFYPTGGGQPGDSGHLDWSGGRIEIATTVKGEGGAIVLIPAGLEPLPPVGAALTQRIDWSLRWSSSSVMTLSDSRGENRTPRCPLPAASSRLIRWRSTSTWPRRS